MPGSKNVGLGHKSEKLAIFYLMSEEGKEVRQEQKRCFMWPSFRSYRIEHIQEDNV